MVNEHRELGVGDRVLVPWGLDEVEGEIVEVYNTGLGPRAKVQLQDDPDGPTVVVPLDSLMPKQPQIHIDEGVAAIAAARDYEQLVGLALERNVAELTFRRPELNVFGPFIPRPDSGADFEYTFGTRQILVQVKYLHPSRRVSTDTILTAAGLADKSTAVLLVANAPLASAAQHRLEQLWGHRIRAWFALWRSSRDDKELRAAFNRLVSSW